MNGSFTPKKGMTPYLDTLKAILKYDPGKEMKIRRRKSKQENLEYPIIRQTALSGLTDELLSIMFVVDFFVHL